MQLAGKLNPDLTVVGPELPLTLGVVDEFQDAAGPSSAPRALRRSLESSKSFAKEFMQRHRIPTAKYSVCITKEEVREALKLFHAPVVVKADGLAAGKGVVIAHIQGGGAAHRRRDASRQDAGRGRFARGAGRMSARARSCRSW